MASSGALSHLMRQGNENGESEKKNLEGAT